MNTNTVEEAIANIAATSEALDKFCNNPKSHCSADTANLLERMSWELHKLSNELQEINYLYDL